MFERTYYLDAVTEDAREYIKAEYTTDELREALKDRDELTEELNDKMWAEDAVTGNGSGSYTFDRSEARENVFTDIETVIEALKEFCIEAETIARKFLDEDWEYFDVTARCYVLGQAIEKALDRIEMEVY